MKHDLFEFNAAGMSAYDRAWRIAFLVGCIAVTAMDLFVWRAA